MDNKDLEQIRTVVREEFRGGFAQIWEHSLEPTLNDILSKIEALDSKVKNYLELSDKRYFELQRKNLILAKWIKVLADKAGIKIDLKELGESS